MPNKKRLKSGDYVRNYLKINPAGTYIDFCTECGKIGSRRNFDRIKKGITDERSALGIITKVAILPTNGGCSQLAGSGKTADIFPMTIKPRRVDPVKASAIKDKAKFARDFLKTSPDSTYTEFVEKFGKVLSDCLFYLERKKIQGGDKTEEPKADKAGSSGGLNIPLLLKMFLMNNPEATFGDYEETYPDIKMKQSAFYYMKKTLQNSGLVLA